MCYKEKTKKFVKLTSTDKDSSRRTNHVQKGMFNFRGTVQDWISCASFLEYLNTIFVEYLMRPGLTQTLPQRPPVKLSLRPLI